MPDTENNQNDDIVPFLDSGGNINYSPHLFRWAIVRALEISSQTYGVPLYEIQKPPGGQGNCPTIVGISRQLAAYIIYEVIGLKHKKFIADYIFSERAHVQAVHWIRDAQGYSIKYDPKFKGAVERATQELGPVFNKWKRNPFRDRSIRSIIEFEKNLRKSIPGIQLSMFGPAEINIKLLRIHLQKSYPDYTPHICLLPEVWIGWKRPDGFFIPYTYVMGKIKKYSFEKG